MSRAASPRRSPRQRLLTTPLVTWPLAFLLAAIVRLTYLSNRVTYHCAPGVAPYRNGQQPAIYCFWHGRMIMQPFIRPHNRRMHVLVSLHRDGAFIGTIMRCFGIHAISGSKSRGGARAMRAMLQQARRGDNIAITPDGPRGPAQRAESGAVYLAARSGHAIVPITFAATRHVRFRSWDRFMLPKPFGRIHFALGAPMHVPAKADAATLARLTGELENTLNILTRQADEACGIGA